ncbi:MAG: hypothetical protein JSU81_03685 [Candidatus Coatesbacteria bacterium]|nr:MAG: hypothetical protein JSU81_03685 [Candidatus Coatesbacteria bacterium]
MVLTTGAGAEWEIETVGEALFYGSDSPVIAVDQNGGPHISYYSAHIDYSLKYCYRARGEWEVENVQIGPKLEPVAISADATGAVHLYYVDREEGSFKYALRNDSRWDIVTVNPGVIFGAVGAVRDRRGNTHIVYYDETNEKLKYVRSDGRTWKGEVVAAGIEVIGPLAISVDGSGVPHITYYKSEWPRNSGLVYARWNGKKFEVKVVDDLAYWTVAHSLAVDDQGRVYVANYDSIDDDLDCVYIAGGTTKNQVIDNKKCVGLGNALAVRSEGKPCISYYSRYRLKFAYETSNGWCVRTVDTIEDLRSPWETRTALALDGKDTPHIAYYDWVAEKVMYATWEDADWRMTTGDEGEVDIDRSRAALTANWDDAGALIEPGEPWRPFITPDNYYDDNDRRAPIPLRAKPEKDAPVVKTIVEDTQVEVIDGRSVWGTYVDGLLEEDVYSYFVWLKVRAGEVEGWVNQLPFREGFVGGEVPMWEGVVNMTRVTFTAPYAPLYEGPSTEYPVVREEWGRGIEAGSTYTVLARCGDWLCVKGAWLPADTAGLEFEYLGFIWEPYEYALFCFYLPRGNEIGRIFYTYRAYFKLAELPDEDPLFSIKTKAGEFAIVPKTLRRYGFHETSQGDYEVVISPPVRREDIEAVTFTVGGGGERIKFTLDPREAWAEYDAQK